MIDKAIHKINPNAQFKIINDDLDNIEWINGTTPISKADIETKIAELPTAEEEATAKATAQASGNTKLLNLGLTQAEATAMTVYTPE
jgi:hypothetical protein